MNAARHKQAGTDGACPVRTCIASRVARAPGDLIRFALAPDGAIVPDLAQNLPGRGAWVTNSREWVTEAVRKKAFERAWRRKVTVPADLCDCIDDLLTKRALEALSLANKAGFVVTGFSNVDQAVAAGEAAVLVQGEDASDDGKSRLARKFQAICGELEREPIVIALFSIAQLSLAMGRSNVVHAALKGGRVSDGFVRAARRAVQFRTSDIARCQRTLDAPKVESPSEPANEIGRETE